MPRPQQYRSGPMGPVTLRVCSGVQRGDDQPGSDGHQGGGHVIGSVGGAESVVLTVNNLPAHTHAANCSSLAGSSAVPTGHFWAETVKGGSVESSYGTAANAQMAASAIAPTGAGAAVSVMQPYLTLNFIIALQGIFPSQN